MGSDNSFISLVLVYYAFMGILEIPATIALCKVQSVILERNNRSAEKIIPIIILALSVCISVCVAFLAINMKASIPLVVGSTLLGMILINIANVVVISRTKKFKKAQ